MSHDLQFTNTQLQFAEYIKEEMYHNHQIIPYKCEGHFGSSFVWHQLFPQAEIIRLSELKAKHRKTPFSSFMQIIISFAFLLINRKYDFDLEGAQITILDNLQNVYLGIDKQHEFLKYLRITHHKHKLGKIKFIVRADTEITLSNEDYTTLKLLYLLINAGKLRNTLLILNQHSYNTLLMKGMICDTQSLPFFSITANDISWILHRNNKSVLGNIDDHLHIIKKLGIKFYLDNYKYVEKLSNTTNLIKDTINSIGQLLEFIMEEKEVEGPKREKVITLLEFSSFFGYPFSNIDIANFENNALESRNLDIACDLSILKTLTDECQYHNSLYLYTAELFREYYYKKYSHDLTPLPQKIYVYFENNFPFDYIAKLKIVRVDSSFTTFTEQQSLIIMGYYYAHFIGGSSTLHELRPFITKDSLSDKVINFYERFKNKTLSTLSSNNILNDITQLLNEYQMDCLVSCAVLTMCLQITKEEFTLFPSDKFSVLIRQYKNCIINIPSSSNYELYWQLHFKSQYIAFSLEENSVDEKASRIFYHEIERSNSTQLIKEYIDRYHLRDLSRIKLLSYSLGLSNAGDILKQAFESSQNSTVFKELARINYSAYLIENGEFTHAEQVLGNVNHFFLSNIDIDTKNAYINNYQLTKFLLRKETIDRTILELEAIISENAHNNDDLIIRNNLYVLYLMQEDYAMKGVSKLHELISLGNAFNNFYATHNLLMYYFFSNDRESFDELYPHLYVPKLLKDCEPYFLKKFQEMRLNWADKSIWNMYNAKFNCPNIFSMQYLLCPLERWFE